MSSDERHQRVANLDYPRRYRFTKEEKAILRESFAKEPYPQKEEIERLASLCNDQATPKTISNWFQNQRQAQAKAAPSIESSVSSTSIVSSTSLSTIPSMIPSLHSSRNPAEAGDPSRVPTPSTRYGSSREAPRVLSHETRPPEHDPDICTFTNIRRWCCPFGHCRH